MQIIGLIAEYNPFHNGHIYHIQKIKELYPDSLLILVLNGYFLERGEISILTKEDKTKLALLYGIDLVVELPVFFGVQASDVFANTAIKILNILSVDTIIFGSECNDPNILLETAQKQLNKDFNKLVKQHLKEGINYPTAISKSLGNKKFEPNDLLGISYAKTILKNNYNIEIKTIKRTNDYNDLKLSDNIISAKNIRNKLKNNQSISSFVPEEVLKNIQNINEELLFNILKHNIITNHHLKDIITVNEGIENHLLKCLASSHNLEEFINNLKTKRYTTTYLNRLLIHILLGITKTDKEKITLDYIHILGFNQNGQKYLKNLKPKIKTTPIPTSLLYHYELISSLIYEMLTNNKVSTFETSKKPIIFDKNSSISYNNEHEK